MNQRNHSLDALRGLAIFGMILAGSIAFGILPAWMYHAQEPPPAHEFNPALPGISWVDLVFPFFLFSMGAAIPLSLKKKIAAGSNFPVIMLAAAKRFVLLVFFALFSRQMTAAGLHQQPRSIDYGLSLLAFVLLFLQFFQPPAGNIIWRVLKAGAWLLAGTLICTLPFESGKGFSLYNSDIIILILANVSFAGTLWWYVTRQHPLWRMALLPLLAGIYLSGTQPGNWCYELLHWSPVPWLYNSTYLKYLFILLPGTLAGDWMLEYSTRGPLQATRPLYGLGCCAALVLIANVCLLFSRHTTINFFVTVAGLISCFIILQKNTQQVPRLLLLFLQSGTYLVLLGLCFEAFEGGIKKDPATFSYYFVSAGLAFLVLIIFYALQHSYAGRGIIHYLSLAGRNPMVAYVGGNLLLLPLLYLTGTMSVFEAMAHQPWSGVLRGFLFTGMVSGLAAWMAARQWYWKT
ncbi:DUF5009 domain-containing protein [Chitinophaga sp. 212800010-3]|uniref:DUF5009 domain-containing protein n=1 Tax=unclassified Chitinophaga TaxID=2619133 RepID=UPI002DEA855B|nr:putative acyltransferase [Chitinophaga sp. 212800010-3]